MYYHTKTGYTKVNFLMIMIPIGTPVSSLFFLRAFSISGLSIGLLSVDCFTSSEHQNNERGFLLIEKEEGGITNQRLMRQRNTKRKKSQRAGSLERGLTAS